MFKLAVSVRVPVWLRGDVALQRWLGEPADADFGGKPAFLHELQIFGIEPRRDAVAIARGLLTTIEPGPQGRVARPDLGHVQVLEAAHVRQIGQVRQRQLVANEPIA